LIFFFSKQISLYFKNNKNKFPLSGLYFQLESSMRVTIEGGDKTHLQSLEEGGPRQNLVIAKTNLRPIHPNRRKPPGDTRR